MKKKDKPEPKQVAAYECGGCGEIIRMDDFSEIDAWECPICEKLFEIKEEAEECCEGKEE